MRHALLLGVLALVGVACQAAPPTATTAPEPTRRLATPTAAAAGAAQTPGHAAPAMAAAAAAGPTPERRLAVVATFSVLGDLVRNVAGDRAEVIVLVGPGQDAHTYEPSPADVATIGRAALVFENGVGFEGWLVKQYAAAGARGRRIVVTDGITLQRGGRAHADGAEPAADMGGELDPHVGHDVRHAARMVAVVRDALVQADPGGAPAYAANADRYLAELVALDAWVVDQVGTLPEPRRTLVTNHDTLGYFASRYGFAVVGTALPVSTEGAEPSAGELARLVGRIRRAGAPAIFAENVSNPKLMERIAREAGVRVAPPLYTDALSPPGGEADTYAKMVRYNVATIVGALKG